MLKKIKLENFRNHKKFELELDHTTALIGPNGSGKTNILEAVVFLSFCRSFRDDDKKNIINFESDFARVSGDELEVFFSRYPRLIMKVKERGIPRKIIDFVGIQRAVVFSPETISIITGSPGDRRKFLDVMISQVNREYFAALINYKKVRTQRNSLLIRIAQRESAEVELDFWDMELCRHAKVIYDKRGEAIKFLEGLIPEIYQTISGNKTFLLKLKYLKNSISLEEDLHRNRAREIAYGGTIFGPHRDDLVFNLNGRNMANFASRGEIRSAILALKIAELKFLEKNNNGKDYDNKKSEPILLLDDIFSEFDPERRKHLGNLILQYQSLITATEREHLSKELLAVSKVIELC